MRVWTPHWSVSPCVWPCSLSPITQPRLHRLHILSVELRYPPKKSLWLDKSCPFVRSSQSVVCCVSPPAQSKASALGKSALNRRWENGVVMGVGMAGEWWGDQGCCVADGKAWGKPTATFAPRARRRNRPLHICLRRQHHHRRGSPNLRFAHMAVWPGMPCDPLGSGGPNPNRAIFLGAFCWFHGRHLVERDDRECP